MSLDFLMTILILIMGNGSAIHSSSFLTYLLYVQYLTKP